MKAVQTTRPPEPATLSIENDVGVEGHVAFFQSLQSRYNWPASQWQPISTSIERLTQRARDNRLFLGVVGEFSAGKSTLINALLREDILKTDILPATTCATTILEYGPKVDAVLHLNSGKKIRYSLDGISVLERLRQALFGVNPLKEFDSTRRFIHLYTAEEEQASSILQVNVTHPNQKLESGLVIVDTPGINVENPRHATLTQDAVRTICDAVCILVPAPAACSQTLVGFVKEHLGESLHRCLVIVTKIDLIPAREREQLMRFVASRLERECGASFVAVLPAAPYYMLNGHQPSPSLGPDTADSFRKAFLDTEKTVLSILASSRSAAIAEHVLLILLSILTQFEEAVRNRKAEYAERHESLERNRLQDIRTFVETRKKRYRTKIAQATRGLGSTVSESVADSRERLYGVIEGDIFGATCKDELKAAVTKKTEVHFKYAFMELSAISKELHAQLVNVAKECHTEFEGEFRECYRSLATLGGLLIVPDGTAGSLASSQRNVLQQAGEVSAPVVEAVDNSNTAANVGVFTGAAVGTCVIPIPVIGTLIGGGLGWLFSTLFGPSLAELQQQAATGARQSVTGWAEKCEASLHDVVRRHIEQSLQSLDAAIAQYSIAYEAKVREMIRKDEDAKAQLEEYVILADRDLRELRKREHNVRRLFDVSRSSDTSMRRAQ